MTYSHICSHFWFYSLRPSYGGVMIVMVTVSLQQYFNRLHAVHELRSSRCSSRFRKSRRTRDEIAHVQWIIEKAREFQKKRHLFLLYLIYFPHRGQDDLSKVGYAILLRKSYQSLFIFLRMQNQIFTLICTMIFHIDFLSVP